MNEVTLRALSSMPGVVRLVGDAHVAVSGVSSDSRRVTAGDLFAAVPGRNVDGSRFVAQAIERGARAVLAEQPLDLSVPVIVVDQVRARLGPLAHRIYGEPTRTLRTVGVTGTNGKTTVTHLLESVLAASGQTPALLGTIALRGPMGEEVAELTTPEADRLARFASEALAAKATHLVMEVASVAVSERRIAGTTFEVAAFTNLTHDHLDYHGTLDAYGEEKARLFTEYAPKSSVIVVDQPFGQALAARAHGRVLRCAQSQDVEAEIRATSFRSTREGIRAEVETPRGNVSLESPLFGAHNLENLLVTLGCAIALDLDLERVLAALRTAVGAPGRMERVADPRGVLVLVDYAHTPDALARALAALRPLTEGRLWVVFGCGGDRDRKKREPMAEAALLGADLAVLTSDNPRTENVQQILADMEPGAARHASRLTTGRLRGATRGYAIIPDRAQAIAAVLEAARPSDTVLLAGKGHESYQVVGTTRYAFDDRIQAARALSSLGGG